MDSQRKGTVSINEATIRDLNKGRKHKTEEKKVSFKHPAGQKIPAHTMTVLIK